MAHAKISILYLDEQEVIVKDIGPWNIHPSVTNDAEHVVANLFRHGILGEHRLFYFDSNDDYDELKHDGHGKFLGFAPARNHWGGDTRMIAHILSLLFPPQLPGRIEDWEPPAEPRQEQGSIGKTQFKKYRDGIARHFAEAQ